VTIKSRNALWGLDVNKEWIFQASAKIIEERDIVCLLHGASIPTIIRMYPDHIAVIVIAATTLTSNGFGLLDSPQLQREDLHDFLLVWNWENPQGELEDQEEYETLTKISHQALKDSKAESGDYLDIFGRLWNDIAILDSSGDQTRADDRLKVARNGYMAAFGKKYLPTYINRCGRTPLSFAAGEGDEDLTKLLLEKADPDIKDSYGRTPLSQAAENGQQVIVKLLLETGQVEVDLRNHDSGQTPLSYAAKEGHEAVVKLLLETGKVEINSKDNRHGQTPLSFAAEGGHKAVVKLLLETGKAEINSSNVYNRTPLSFAAKGAHEAVVKLLLETGKAEIDLQDDSGRTALSYATEWGLYGNQGIMKLLNDSKTDRQTPPLLRAARNGHKAFTKLFH
jgi:ankyrin repeat protein